MNKYPSVTTVYAAALYAVLFLSGLFMARAAIPSESVTLTNQSAPFPTISSETPEQYHARIAWWRDARLGMFIHWDMSSVAGTEISWGRHGSQPLDIHGNPAGVVTDPVYDNLYKHFNPVKYDAKAWVKLAKEAGMKYIVFTAKHHGGFCMWDTKQTSYNIMNTPYGKDVLRQLADACHEEGIHFCIYYSPRDWHHPDYGIGDNAKYVEYMNAQIKELLTGYGKVDLLWFDSYGKGDLLKFWKINETWNLIKSINPSILINNRLCELGAYDKQPPQYLGDFLTPEQRLGGYNDKRPWESCMTVSNVGAWSYRKGGGVKSFDGILKILVSSAVGDGNLLLDVGPNAEGVIPADQVERLHQLGEWLKVNGESIYGTRGGPFKPASYGGSTRKGNTIYLHILNWPTQGSLILPSVSAKLTGARLLAGGKVDAKQGISGLEISVPVSDRQKIDTVVALTFEGDVLGLPVQSVHEVKVP